MAELVASRSASRGGTEFEGLAELEPTVALETAWDVEMTLVKDKKYEFFEITTCYAAIMLNCAHNFPA